jgi:hypothetical protein
METNEQRKIELQTTKNRMTEHKKVNSIKNSPYQKYETSNRVEQ